MAKPKLFASVDVDSLGGMVTVELSLVSAGIEKRKRIPCGQCPDVNDAIEAAKHWANYKAYCYGFPGATTSVH